MIRKFLLSKYFRAGLMLAILSAFFIPIAIPWTDIQSVEDAQAKTVPELPTEFLVPALGVMVAVAAKGRALARGIVQRR